MRFFGALGIVHTQTFYWFSCSTGEPKSTKLTGYFFPVKTQSLTPRERLREWADQKKGRLGEKFIEEATETAELCYLAFSVFEEGDNLEIDYPGQAVISKTKFGARPSYRPPTSQPAACAAYYLEQCGADRSTIHEFIEALLQRTHEQSELRKLIKPSREKVAKAAKATGDSILAGLVEGTFAQEQTAQVEQLCSELGEATNSYMVSHLRHILKQRLGLFPRIKAGEFDQLPPLMLIGNSTHVGRATLSGPMMQTGGSTVSFPVFPFHTNLPLRSAYILGVPAWYPLWRGDL